MPVTRGMITSQTDTTNVKLDVSEVIDQLSPDDVPILNMVGRDSLKTPCTQLTHEWLEDTLRPRSGTLAAAYTVGQGQLTLTAAEGRFLVPDDLILVDDIVFRVQAGVPEGDILTVTVIRGTDAAIANGRTWRKISHSAQEGGNARTDASKTTIAKPFNYTQIFKDWTMVTGTMQALDRYGYANERAYQEEKILKQLAIDLEFTLLYGVRTVTPGPPRRSSMGGLYEYIYIPGVANNWSTVVNNSGAELTEAVFNNTLQQIWAQGGMPDYVICGGFNKRLFTKWAAPRIRTSREESEGGSNVSIYESDFGTLAVILDRWIRPSDLIICTSGDVGIGPLVTRQFSSRLLPVQGDYDWYEILGEYTMEVHAPSVSHGWIYNTATA